MSDRLDHLDPIGKAEMIGFQSGVQYENHRIIKLLADDSPIWDDPRGVQAALLAEIKGESK